MAFHANAEAVQVLATVGNPSAVWERCQIVGDTTTGGETDVRTLKSRAQELQPLWVTCTFEDGDTRTFTLKALREL